MTSAIDPVGRMTNVGYNAFGRYVGEEWFEPLPGVSSPSIAWGFQPIQTIGLYKPIGSGLGSSSNPAPLSRPSDAVGKQIDPNSKETLFETDRFGNVTQTTDPLLNVTTYQYDANGLVTQMVRNATALGGAPAETINYAYNSAGKLAGITYAGTGDSASWNYDPTFNQVTSVTDEMGRTTTYTVDASGNHLSMTEPDPDGGGPLPAPKTEYEYNLLGQLTKVKHPDPVTGLPGPDITQYFYTASGLLEIIIHPDGSDELFTYDVDDNLISYRNQRLLVTDYEHDGLGRIKKEILPDPDGVGGLPRPEISYTYDPLGRITGITYADPDGAGPLAAPAVTYGYHPRGVLTSTTGPDPDGGGPILAPTTQYEYDALLRLTKMTDPLGAETEYEYDDAGRMTRAKYADPATGTVTANSRITEYEYDGLDRLIKVTEPDPDPTDIFPTPVTQYQYDNRNRVIQLTDAEGGITQFNYNADSSLNWEQDANNHRTEYAYDGMGRLHTVTPPDPDGDGLFGGPLPAPVVTYAYDARSRVTSVSDVLGRSTEYEYDEHDRLTKVTLPDPDGTGALLQPFTDYVYDDNGNLAQTTDQLSRTTVHVYDPLDRLIETTLPADVGEPSPVIAYEYDNLNRRTKIIDALLKETLFKYDGMSRLTEMTLPDPDGGGPLVAPVMKYQYDAASNLTAETDPENRQTAYTYDFLGRLIQVNPPGAAGATNYEYDVLNRRTKTIDPLGEETVFRYDNLERLVRKIDPGPTAPTTVYSFDAVGNLIGLTDPEENKTAFRYDALDRLIEETNHFGLSRFYAYDAVGNLQMLTNRNGWQTTYAYDNLDRRTQETWLDGLGVALHTISYDYDNGGRLSSAGDSDSSYDYTYTARDQLATVTMAATGFPALLLSHSYNVRDEREETVATVNFIDDFVNTYTYDNIGRMTRIEQTDGTPAAGYPITDKRVDFAYNKAGQFTEIKRYEDLAATELVATSTYTYDTSARLTGLTHDLAGTPPNRVYTWAYDAANRLTSVSSPDGTSTFTYDATHQLTDATHSYQTDEDYVYDDNGNRQTVNGDSYVTGPNNQLLSDGTHSYVYDGEGNRIKKTNLTTLETVDYTWDHRNRLVRVEFKDALGIPTKIVDYTYDVFDRRIAKEVDNGADGTIDVTERYVYDGGNIVLRFDDAGSLTNRYLHGPELIDQVFADEDAVGEILWLLSDNQGTVRDVVDYDATLNDTSIVNHIQYDAFGNITAISNAASAVFYAYTGQEWDPDANLYYYAARWYDPFVGRFLSEDPIGFSAGDTNLSRYVGNSPTNLIDPTGTEILFAKPEHNIASSIGLWVQGGPAGRQVFFVYPHPVAKRFMEDKKIKWIFDHFRDDAQKYCECNRGKLTEDGQFRYTADLADLRRDLATVLGAYGGKEGDFGTNAFGTFTLYFYIEVDCDTRTKRLTVQIWNTWSIKSLTRNPFTRKPFAEGPFKNPVTGKVINPVTVVVAIGLTERF